MSEATIRFLIIACAITLLILTSMIINLLRDRIKAKYGNPPERKTPPL